MPGMDSQKVELSSVEVLPGGEGFVLGLVAANQEVHRIELPSWAVHQLMRLLPRLDASVLQAQGYSTGDLIAYPVVEWCVLPAGAEREVALSLKSNRQVESAYLISLEEARAFHAALGEAIDASPEQRGSTTAHGTVN
jgi:hypothetical protein